jgi:predicted DNA-binding transcriptional regulator AlpA
MADTTCRDEILETLRNDPLLTELFDAIRGALGEMRRGDRALDSNEVQRRTGVSRNRMYQLIKTGDFPPSRKRHPDAKVGSFWLESDIDRWLRTRPVVPLKPE